MIALYVFSYILVEFVMPFIIWPFVIIAFVIMLIIKIIMWLGRITEKAISNLTKGENK